MPALVLRLRERSRALRLGLVAGACLAAVAILALRGPIFEVTNEGTLADRRTFFGLPNAWNVLSNLPFAAVGALGLARVRPLAPALRPAVFLCFLAIAAVALCSGFHHLAPSPERLLVDRLPITLAFVGLFAWVLGDRLHPRWALALPLPGALLAFLALWLWSHGGTGTGDLRPYALVQVLPLVAIPLLLTLFPGELRETRFLAALALYGLALACQALDARIFALGEIVSGHTVKHLLAAAACACLVPPAPATRSRPSAPARR